MTPAISVRAGGAMKWRELWPVTWGSYIPHTLLGNYCYDFGKVLVLSVSYIKGEIWVRSVVSNLIPRCLER